MVSPWTKSCSSLSIPTDSPDIHQQYQNQPVWTNQRLKSVEVPMLKRKHLEPHLGPRWWFQIIFFWMFTPILEEMIQFDLRYFSTGRFGKNHPVEFCVSFQGFYRFTIHFPWRHPENFWWNGITQAILMAIVRGSNYGSPKYHVVMLLCVCLYRGH